jgi:hypothetical protein
MAAAANGAKIERSCVVPAGAAGGAAGVVSGASAAGGCTGGVNGVTGWRSDSSHGGTQVA